MAKKIPELKIVGGGLAGSEAAWQAANQGVKVHLYEMRPVTSTGAHVSSDLAELVCSNSLGSKLPGRAAWLLKDEIRKLGSLLLACAEDSAVPAGGALAVDRRKFSELVTRKIDNHENITLIRQEVLEIPDGVTVIATGPLTSNALSKSIMELTGEKHLFFYDAIAPIVEFDSINMEIAFRGSRYGKGDNDDGDYINCPFTKQEYYHFVEELCKAERIELKEFERGIDEGVTAGISQHFEGCLPVETLASRGEDALAYGPMRPVGLRNPHTNMNAYAVVQLRQDNLAGSLYNIVGFQTNLKFSEQRRIFRMIPGLEHAEFERYGQMHRNTYIFSPALIHPTLNFKDRSGLFFAGQIIGVEGYIGNIATGLLAGINAARYLQNKKLLELPRTTMLGALNYYVTHAQPKDFQPMKANFGILPPLDGGAIKGRKQRREAYSARAQNDMDEYLDLNNFA